MHVRSRSLLPMMLLLTLGLLQASLPGCGPDRRAAARAAVHEVEVASTRASEVLRVNHSGSGMRVALSHWLEDMAAIDVRHCPEDYRVQHVRLMESLRRANDVAQVQPDGAMQEIVDAIGGSKAQIAMVDRLEEIDTELKALMRVAEKYRR